MDTISETTPDPETNTTFNDEPLTLDLEVEVIDGVEIDDTASIVSEDLNSETSICELSEISELSELSEDEINQSLNNQQYFRVLLDQLASEDEDWNKLELVNQLIKEIRIGSLSKSLQTPFSSSTNSIQRTIHADLLQGAFKTSDNGKDPNNSKKSLQTTGKTNTKTTTQSKNRTTIAGLPTTRTKKRTARHEKNEKKKRKAPLVNIGKSKLDSKSDSSSSFEALYCKAENFWNDDDTLQAYIAKSARNTDRVSNSSCNTKRVPNYKSNTPSSKQKNSMRKNLGDLLIPKLSLSSNMTNCSQPSSSRQESLSLRSKDFISQSARPHTSNDKTKFKSTPRVTSRMGSTTIKESTKSKTLNLSSSRSTNEQAHASNQKHPRNKNIIPATARSIHSKSVRPNSSLALQTSSLHSKYEIHSARGKISPSQSSTHRSIFPDKDENQRNVKKVQVNIHEIFSKKLPKATFSQTLTRETSIGNEEGFRYY